MRKPPPTAKPLDLGDHRLAHRLEARDALVAVALVGNAVLGPVEDLELADVRPRHERLAARAAKHEHAHRVVGVHLLADLVEPIVHAPGQGVARLGAIEGQRDHRPVAGHEGLVLRRHGARLLRGHR